MTTNARWLAAALLALALAGCGDTTYEFDPVGVGEVDQGREPRPRSNSQFVRAVYADLIGRAPETFEFGVLFQDQPVFQLPIDEQEMLVDVLDGVGDAAPLRDLLVAGLIRSTEVDIPDKDDVDDPADYIAEQFRHYLGREPTAYELAAFVGEWEGDDAVNPRTLVRALLTSREYQSF